MQNDIDDFVLFTDVFGRYGQDLVHNLAEKLDISPSIVLNPADHFFIRFLELFMLNNYRKGTLSDNLRLRHPPGR